MRRLPVPVAFLALLCAAASAHAATIAVVPPQIDTAITGGPAEGSVTGEERPSFSFSATSNDEAFPTAIFHCSVDGATAEPCTSPFQLPALEEEGDHSFSVYAEDPATSDRDASPASRTFAFEEEDEECEAGEEEVEDEEGNVEECESGGTGPVPPPECLLRSARARLFTSPAQEKLRLAIRYTSYAPTDVDVEFRLSSAKGSVKLGEAHGRFAKQGLFHLTEKLNKTEMARVRAAKHFTVDLDIPAAPSSCRRYESRHLTGRRAVHGQLVWLQSDSVFGLAS